VKAATIEFASAARQAEARMIDIKLIRNSPDLVRRAARDKNMIVDIDRVIETDGRRRALEREFDELRHQQNQFGEQIAKAAKDQKAALVAEMGKIKSRLKEIEAELETVAADLQEQMLLMPQIPDPAAPVGRDASENVEVRRVGEPRLKSTFDSPFRDHIELGTHLRIIELERGVKLAGSRNYVLRGAGAMLHEAVLRLAADVMIRKDVAAPGDASRRLRFEQLMVPVLVLDKLMYGTGFFPLHRDEVYLAERDGLSLVGTAEVPVTGFHGDEILDEAELPKLYWARSNCFRREAGAAGRDTYGLYRIHFFDKIEQVVICKSDAGESHYWHERIIENAEEVLRLLELPYRVLEVCTGDMGQGKVRMFDIETWMPSREAYGETHSASRFHDFQARRLNLRYRDADGKVQYCHTLNNTVIASPRILVPILEQYQNADGNVTVPAVLRPYMGGMDVISPPRN
jgi:seryl-tRNA synthetase